MGYSQCRVVIVIAIAIVSMIMMSSHVSGQGPSPGQCAQERQQGIDLCKGVTFGQSPSAACCNLLRTSPIIECVCPVMDAKLATLLTVKKVTEVLTECGRAVPRRIQCGSLYFP